jgi:hypothetical protein
MRGRDKGKHVLQALLVAGIGSFAVLAAACQQEPATQQAAQAGTGRPECPVDTIVIRDSTDSVVKTITVVPLAQSQTKVPEFNDCQRFVVGDTSYDSLYAIYAAFHMERLPGMLKPTPERVKGRLGQRPDTSSGDGAAPPPGVTSALSFAEIVSWGGTYPPLGIKPGFNCLYVFKDHGRRRARLIPVALTDSACNTTIRNPLAETAGKELIVLRDEAHPEDGTTDGDFPPVARWDWDSLHHKQYIGIKCDREMWCAVGDSDLVPSPQQAESPPFDANDGVANMTSLPAKQHRTWRIKGWYDFQRLAVRQDGKTKPSQIWGKIFPHPMLGTHNDKADFSKGWVHVATVQVTGRYDGAAVHFGEGFNKIYLCMIGDEDHCTGLGVPTCPDYGTGIWMAKIVLPSDSVYYRCVHQRDHTDQAQADGYSIPAATRWRWLADDETTWERCTEGCCETRP